MISSIAIIMKKTILNCRKMDESSAAFGKWRWRQVAGKSRRAPTFSIFSMVLFILISHSVVLMEHFGELELLEMLFVQSGKYLT